MRAARAIMLPTVAVAFCASLSVGCKSFKDRVTFVGPMVLAGKEVSADRLNYGREHYVQNCYACHGLNGDGKGPASHYYRPPPRDLTKGLYKFGGVVNGLPHDDDFKRILRHGLQGTPMLAWDVPDDELDPIIDYIKTLSDSWQEEDALGEQIAVDSDPWAGKEKEAIARGEKIYHGLATCQQCHAAYITKQGIYEASKEVGNRPITVFRPNQFQPQARESEYVADGKKMVILPPDFLFNKVRTGSEVPSLFRIISAGIPGTAMPTWHKALPDPDIWAIAHYVHSLIDMKDTPQALALRQRLASEPEFVPPPAPAQPATPPSPAPGEKSAPAGASPTKASPAKPAPANPAKPAPASKPG